MLYNFSAGPACLADSVLDKAEKELKNYNGYGLSVMEMSHRSKIYLEIFDETKALLKKLLNIPDNYHILFLQGGASTQFSMIALNLLSEDNKKADYINTGIFAQKAIDEAQRYGDIKVIASSKEDNYKYIPDISTLNAREDANYLHICQNNTIVGSRYIEIPKHKALVSDLSSSILSEHINIEDFGLVYAGAQKNLGIAGLTIVIIRDDLVKEPLDICPTMLKYKTQVDKDSMYNTPATYSIYITKLVLEWIDLLGGLKEIEKMNIEKANLIYNFLDNSNFYNALVDKKYRSLMNVCYKLPNKELDIKFAKEAEKNSLLNLKGHRDAGGIRASIYNAMPIDGVKALIDFMKKFESENR